MYCINKDSLPTYTSTKKTNKREGKKEEIIKIIIML